MGLPKISMSYGPFKQVDFTVENNEFKYENT